MFKSARIFIAFLSLLTVGCAQDPQARAPLFEDLGRFHRPVTTSSPEAQRYFDQGLLLCFAFNHQEAVRSFEEAARLDPRCAMAFWGTALALGPHINNPHVEEKEGKAAHQAARKALELSEGATPVEKDLIQALTRRYADPPPEDRKPLDEAYAEAMRKVHHTHPVDTDVAALFAESLMDLRPWDQWTTEGKPQPGTEEVVAVLASVFRREPDHPLACHLTIHALEASKDPGKALPAADNLRNRAPGAGHLVHMPSHIDVRTGRYADAVEANRKAIAADRRYIERGGIRGFYEIYRAHNFHMLAYAAMFDGRSAIALQAARDMVADLPMDLVDKLPEHLEGYLTIPLHVLVRFGRWEEVLGEPKPAPNRLVSTAMWHYARGVAFSVTGHLEEAEAERASFERAAEAVPEKFQIGNTPARSVMGVAGPMLSGEILFRRGKIDDAFEKLREAVRADEALRYDEPRGWMQPAAHSLGALLLQAGRVEEAEKVYRRDMEHFPENGWSLHGLAECLRRSGRTEEAAKAEDRFKTAWARADVKPPGSCFCRTSA